MLIGHFNKELLPLHKVRFTAQKAEEQNNSLRNRNPIQAYINRDITDGHYFKLWIFWRTNVS